MFQEKEVPKRIDFYATIKDAVKNTNEMLDAKIEPEIVLEMRTKLFCMSYYDFWLKPSNAHKGSIAYSMGNLGSTLQAPIRAATIHFFAAIHNKVSREELITFIMSNSPYPVSKDYNMENKAFLERLYPRSDMEAMLKENDWVVAGYFMSFF